MKEDEQDIDRLFNEMLNQKDFDIPESFLRDINNRLDEFDQRRKNKRRFFFWFFCCIGVLSFILVYSLTSRMREETKVAVEPVSKKSLKEKRISLASKQKNSEPIAISNSDADKIFPSGISAEKKKNIRGEVRKYYIGLNENKVDNSITENRNFSFYEISSHEEQKDTIHKTKNWVAENEYIDIHDHSKIDVIDDSISSQADTNNDNVEKEVNDITENNEDRLAEKEKHSEKWIKEIQLYGGIGTNLFQDKSNHSEYLSVLKPYESRIILPTIGINSLFSYKKIVFGTGIGYNENGEHYTMNVKTLIIKDSTETFVSNDTVYTYTFQYSDTVLKLSSFQNRYSQLSIPLYAGYRFHTGKFEIIPKLGIQFDIGIGSKYGNYPKDTSAYVTEFKSNRFSVSYLIQLELRRNIKNWHVFMTPYFRSSIIPNISEAILRRNYSSYGIQVGIGYRF